MRRRPLVLGIVAAGIAALVGWDLCREPSAQVSASVLVGGVQLYQRTLSPRLAAAGVKCRFRPSCSDYAAAVIRRHGALRGSWRAARRILRCGPWTGAGTSDPP